MVINEVTSDKHQFEIIKFLKWEMQRLLQSQLYNKDMRLLIYLELTYE